MRNPLQKNFVKTRTAIVELDRPRYGLTIVRNMDGEILGHVELLDNGLWRNNLNDLRTFTRQSHAITNLQRYAK